MTTPSQRTSSFRSAVCLTMFLTVFCFLGSPVHAGAATVPPHPAISSEADLAKVVANLKKPETRQRAFSELMQFGGGTFGVTHPGNARMDALRRQAFQAAYADPDVETIVDAEIARLDQPQARMQAVADIIKFSNDQLYQAGGAYIVSDNRKMDALQRKAAKALSQHTDPQTVGAALDSNDRDIRLWGALSFNKVEDHAAWLPLLPELEWVAVKDADLSVRAAANCTLQWYPQARDFLASRVALEKSAYILVDLLNPIGGPSPDEHHQILFRRLLSLLRDPDEAVRHDALACVGFDSNNATMWHSTFEKPIFSRVVELTHSASAQERAAAAYALTNIRNTDKDRVRAAFFRLAADPESDVRWRVAGGLAGQLDRADVRRVIDALLKDRSPEVRYFTVLADGPAKHVQELQKLARCSDSQIAEWASNALKRVKEGNVK